MSEGFICRNSGDGYATINFNTYTGVVHGSLTSSSKVLTERRASLEATSVGDYALFGGGYSVVNSDLVCFGVVDAYNTNLTRTTPTALSVGRRRLAATNVGDYALFAGGDSSNGNYNSTVDYNSLKEYNNYLLENSLLIFINYINNPNLTSHCLLGISKLSNLLDNSTYKLLYDSNICYKIINGK